MANDNKPQGADAAETHKAPAGTIPAAKTPAKGDSVQIVTAYGELVPAKVTESKGDRIDVEFTYRDAKTVITGVTFDPEGKRPDSWTR